MKQNHKTVSGRPPDGSLSGWEKRLLEAFDELWDNFVDPVDALYDADGSRWMQMAGPSPLAGAEAPFGNEQQLSEIRAQCRALAVNNEFAINGHESPLTKALSLTGTE